MSIMISSNQQCNTPTSRKVDDIGSPDGSVKPYASICLLAGWFEGRSRSLGP